MTDCSISALKQRVADLEEQLDAAKAGNFDTGPFRVNIWTGIVSSGGQELKLDPQELRMLCFFSQRMNAEVSSQSLAEVLAGGVSQARRNTVSVYVSRLREKLNGSGVSIQTRHGRGYMMTQESAA